MTLFEVILVGIGLSMDAFAVSICKGLSCADGVKLRHMGIAGIWFGGFQMLMPIIGFFLGSRFYSLIEEYDHWIAFILLALIGANMIREAVFGGDEDTNDSFGVKTMFLMAVATSIDALAVGVTFAFLDVDLWSAAAIIGVTTFIFSASGVKIGSVFGGMFRSRAEIFGGAVLIILGLKILLEHMGIIG